MTQVNKREIYRRSSSEIKAVLTDCTDRISIMASIASILKTNFPYYFWVGFYVFKKGKLVVGPYQGSLGCLEIPPDSGVCGAAASSLKTIIVDDVHAFPGHIACDPCSQSEIVVPVVDKHGRLLAVFDVDSASKNAFDEVDQSFLEQILSEQLVEKETH